MITIRFPESQHDIDAIQHLFDTYTNWCRTNFIRLGFAKEGDPELECFNCETLPGDYIPPKGFLLLATEGEDAAGCVFMKELEAGICEMKRLYVSPEFRSRKVGLALMKALVEQSLALGFKTLYISTHPFMDKAWKLYQSLGFHDIPAYHGDRLQGCSIFMEMELEELHTQLNLPANIQFNLLSYGTNQMDHQKVSL